MDIIDRFSEEKIIPVAVLEKEEYALPLAKALTEGGLYSIEVTFRTNAAARALEIIAKEMPQVFVGAGTILNAEQARTADAAGAKFIVSPGLAEDVIEYGFAHNIPVIPGCVTPTEFIQAKSMGLSLVKFFPAEVYGGVKTIMTFGEVFGDMQIMPTGGIGLHNLKDYLSCRNVCACGGSFMVKKELLREGNYKEIITRSKEAKACTIC